MQLSDVEPCSRDHLASIDENEQRITSSLAGSERVEPNDPDAARTDALTLFGLLVGTLQLSRALNDRALSDQLLAQGVETALKLLDNRA
jgi:hypothetical protein